MIPTLFYGEVGSRVMAFSDELTQVTALSTESVLLTVQYHPLWIAGAAGEFVLRELTPIVRFSNGCTFDVTPYVDDEPQTTQRVALAGAGTVPSSIYPSNSDRVRGSRLGVLVQQVGPRTGDFEVVDVGYAVIVLRRSP